ncbi:nuclear transport factor 2 family protein [Vibrio sp. TH_r3]|uniref:nuclear transport factor 2 family protein n=1 Tax=Vibrio sp. TH_r3 TaxID=3082084 RepID=UPI002954DA82|nr:nuclear transport factor 2 family protein [Vibrio sp. TH_r3]MDV7104902.1 nuclear transport factor 2 family protein [Vibrio sp. TH_r3]
MQRSLWLKKFINVYSELRTDNLATLQTIYHPDVTFIDPLHQVNGIHALLDSFDSSYSNISYCDFVIDHVMQSDEEAAVYWTMTFQHKNLNGHKPVSVEGHSHLKVQDDLIIFHRDYLDVGAMIYEHVPLIGFLVKTIKQRAGQ